MLVILVVTALILKGKNNLTVPIILILLVVTALILKGKNNCLIFLTSTLLVVTALILIEKSGHGGADRFRFEYPNYYGFIKKLYVAVNVFECNVSSNMPKDLKIIGEVAKFEYICMAEYVKYFKTLPKFNDKKNSPKFSLTYGRGE